MAQTYDTFWQQRFARAIEEKMRHEAEIVCSGVCSPEEYKSRTGVLRGLQMAIDAIDEVNTDIKKAEQGSK